MPKSLIRYAFLSITLSAFAAGCTANFAEILEDYKKESNLTFTDCGKAPIPWNCDETLLTQANKVRACLIDAFGSCKAAQATFYFGTTEGDPITEVFFVAPDGKGGCKIDLFVDNTQDYYSDRKVTHDECTTISNGKCGRPDRDGCTLVEEF